MSIQIKRKTVNTEVEKDLILGLIVSDKFIRDIRTILDISHLQVKYTKIVAKWCLDYFAKYEKAPGKDIQNIFKSKARKKEIDSDMIELIEDFLFILDEDYRAMESFNEKLLLDECELYLAERKINIMFENAKSYLIDGKIDKAELEIAKHTRTERPNSSSINILKDVDRIAHILTTQDDVIYRYPGALGNLVGPLCRGDFISYIAPMKRGKSFWLSDFAVRAMLSKLKVLFVSLEMTEKQMLSRIYQNILGQTKREKSDLIIPFFDEYNNIVYETVKKSGMNISSIMQKAEKLQMFVKQGGIQLVCYPSGSANLDTIKDEINNLASYKNFYPDVVIIDYLDILAPEPGSPKETRHRIDHTWKLARGLAQELNALLMTVSQASRATFNKNVDEENVSEDIRKLAHVTHMLALNQSREDKKENIMRMSVLAGREEEFHVDDEVIVLYQYGIGKAYLDSRWKKDVNI